MFARGGLHVACRSVQLHQRSFVVNKVSRAHDARFLQGSYRKFCDGTSPQLDDPDVLRALLADPDNLMGEVHVSKSGEHVLSLDSKVDYSKDFNWAEFESRFGLNHDEDDLFDEQEVQIRKREKIKISSPGKKLRGSLKHAIVHGNDQFPEIWEKDFQNGGGDYFIKYYNEEDHEMNPRHHNTEKGSKTVKKDKSCAAASHPLRHAYMEREVVIRNKAKETLPAAGQEFQQPANRSRPGYERRAMSMEREMEKIAEKVLCKADSLWYEHGANIERVLLSPNMKNLTLFYTLDSESTRPVSWWRKLNTKSAKAVRAALAQQLKTKYVPRVFFQAVTSKRDAPSSTDRTELDMLFDKIAGERNSRCRSKEADKV